MISLNCKNDGKPLFKTKLLKCNDGSLHPSSHNFEKQKNNMKNALNCTGCPPKNGIGTKLNKIV